MLVKLREKWPEGRGVKEFVGVLELHQRYPGKRGGNGGEAGTDVWMRARGWHLAVYLPNAWKRGRGRK
jgi:hypothetical protein